MNAKTEFRISNTPLFSVFLQIGLMVDSHYLLTCYLQISHQTLQGTGNELFFYNIVL